MTFQTEINTYKTEKQENMGLTRNCDMLEDRVKKSVSTDEAAKRLRSLNFIHTVTEIQRA